MQKNWSNININIKNILKRGTETSFLVPFERLLQDVSPGLPKDFSAPIHFQKQQKMNHEKMQGMSELVKNCV